MAPKPDPTDTSDVADVAGALLTSIGLLYRRLRQEPVAGELSLPERSALSWLDRSGPTPPSALAKLEQISPQSMGATLATLEAHGFVARHPDPGDGRRTLMSVTDAGRAVLQDKRSARVLLLARALEAEFSPAELEQLRAVAPLVDRLAQRI